MNPESAQLRPENGARQDFLKAHDEYADAIFRYCYFQTSDRQTALDLAQDTFIKLWEYMAGGKKIEYLKAFIYRIARNSVIDFRRKKKSFSLDKMIEEGFDPSAEKNINEAKETIFEGEEAVRTIRELDAKYRDVLMLRYVDDLSIKEISEIVGESENNISVRIHRALEKLKNILKNKNG